MRIRRSDASDSVVASWVGLAICLLAPGLILWGSSLGFFGKNHIFRILGPELGFWLVVLLVVYVVYRGERRGITSIGFGPLRFTSIIWGGAAAVLVIGISFVGAKLLGLQPPSSHLLKGVERIPLWLRVVIVLTAGCIEEVLYRGYAISRLQELTGSKLIAAIVPLFVFVSYHYPFLGAGQVLVVTVTGAILTGLYLVRRDLVSNIIAHLALDAPFFLLPLLINRLAN